MAGLAKAGTVDRGLLAGGGLRPCDKRSFRGESGDDVVAEAGSHRTLPVPQMFCLFGASSRGMVEAETLDLPCLQCPHLFSRSMFTGLAGVWAGTHRALAWRLARQVPPEWSH